MKRPRNLSPRRDNLTVEHRPITDADRELRRQRQSFEQRERQRMRLPAKLVEEPAPRSAGLDRDVRRFIDKGYSLETAREMAQAMVPHDVRSRWGGDQL
jgi:hypothetical protein